MRRTITRRPDAATQQNDLKFALLIDLKNEQFRLSRDALFLAECRKSGTHAKVA